MAIRDGVCRVQLERIRTRRDRCPVRFVLHLKEEKSPKWWELETFQSVEVKHHILTFKKHQTIKFYSFTVL